MIQNRVKTSVSKSFLRDVWRGRRMPPETPASFGVLLAQDLFLPLTLLLRTKIPVFLLQEPHRRPSMLLKMLLVLCGNEEIFMQRLVRVNLCEIFGCIFCTWQTLWFKKRGEKHIWCWWFCFIFFLFFFKYLETWPSCLWETCGRCCYN